MATRSITFQNARVSIFVWLVLILSPASAHADQAENWFRQGEAILASATTAAHLYDGASLVRRAAEQGHTPAQFKLGQLYAVGRGVERSHDAAATWYRKAAESGLREA